jgi:hypothetical protein
MNLTRGTHAAFNKFHAFAEAVAEGDTATNKDPIGFYDRGDSITLLDTESTAVFLVRRARPAASVHFERKSWQTLKPEQARSRRA